jgi:hypothetical protein
MKEARLQRKARRRRQAGHSLVEVTIAATILALVLISVTTLATASDRAADTGTAAALLGDRSADAMERLFVELRTAELESLTPDPLPDLAVDELTYRTAIGFEDNEVIWSTDRRLGFEYAAGEEDNGLDDNGNGLVDEGVVVLTEDVGGPEERERILTRRVRERVEGEEDNGLDDNGNGLVDERGFYVERVGETLILRLSLERRDSQGRVLSRIAQTATRLRN